MTARRGAQRRSAAAAPPTTPPAEVAAVIAGYPPAAQALLMAVRRLILNVADAEGVGPLSETLKWSEPAYLTEATGAGSTVRMAWKPKSPDTLALLFHCQTTLVDTFRTRFPELCYQGNRAILLDLNESLPEPALRWCVAAALTYHRRKRG